MQREFPLHFNFFLNFNLLFFIETQVDAERSNIERDYRHFFHADHWLSSHSWVQYFRMLFLINTNN